MQLKTNILLLLLALLIGCKSNSTSGDVPMESIINDEIPSSFIQFHDRFHKDQAFQISRTVFPLPGKGDTSKWSEEAWSMHKPFDNIGNEYARTYSNFQDIITERIIHKSGLFEMNRRFAPIDGAWHLIYYEIIEQEVDLTLDTLAHDTVN